MKKIVPVIVLLDLQDNRVPADTNSKILTANKHAESVPPCIPDTSVYVEPVFDAAEPVLQKTEKDGSFQDAVSEFLAASDAAYLRGSVLVARGGTILFSRSCGMANEQRGIKNSPRTKFPIGSVTKQFTAMAVMQLFEQGCLHIYDRLSKYLPDFPRSGDITIKHLLTHTSGIIDYTFEDVSEFDALPLEDVTALNIIKIIAEKPLKFEPGKKYSYSNTGYLILGHIVEQVSGLCYEAYLKKHIFRPLGMNHTGLIFSDGEQKYKTKAYSCESALPIHCDEHDLRGAFSAGGLYSTAEDMYLWEQALHTEKLLSKEYKDLMFMPHKAMNESFSYAFGWVIENCCRKYGRKFYHGGAINGFTANISRYVDKDITIIMLANEDQFSLLGNLETKIMELIAG